VSFDYNEIRSQQQSSGTQWASYSDLFMVLAFIFLLMYVVSSLRTGMISVTAHAEIKEVRQELELYEAVKNQYLAGQNSSQEEKIYQDIIGQISLLENEASKNKQKLAQQMQAQAARESSLNQYQLMIVSMMNANTVARAEAARRLSSQQQQNQELQQFVSESSANVEALQQQLQKEEAQIAKLRKRHSVETEQREQRIEILKASFEQNQAQLAVMEQVLRAEEQERAALQRKHQQESHQQVASYAALKKQLEDRQHKVSTLSQTLETESKAKAKLQREHDQQTYEFVQKYQALRSSQSRSLDQLAALESQIEQETLQNTSLEKAYAEETRRLESQVEGLTSEYGRSQVKLSQLQRALQQSAAEKKELEATLVAQAESLEGEISELSAQYDQSRSQAAKLEQALAEESGSKSQLENSLAEQTQKLNGKIRELTQMQGQSQAELAALEKRLGEQAAEKAVLKDASAAEVAGLRDKHQNLQDEYKRKLGELASLEQGIEDGKTEIDNLSRAHQGQLETLEEKYRGLEDAYEKNRDEVASLKSSLNGAQADLKKAAAEIDQTGVQLANTLDELEKATELAKSRQKVAGRIKNEFVKAGIDADVDGGSGDVILDFGKNYFDTNSADLKPGMRKTIREAIPVYARSLFDDPSSNATISAIEIIGFASPTYGGKPVNPTELSIDNRQAVDYNLDLSYARARSIFDYVFDTDKLTFDHQNSMLPLIKVTGRSFFSERVDPADSGNLSQKEFCKQYDCYGSQRVIIKFGLTEKEKTS